MAVRIFAARAGALLLSCALLAEQTGAAQLAALLGPPGAQAYLPPSSAARLPLGARSSGSAAPPRFETVRGLPPPPGFRPRGEEQDEAQEPRRDRILVRASRAEWRGPAGDEPEAEGLEAHGRSVAIRLARRPR